MSPQNGFTLPTKRPLGRRLAIKRLFSRISDLSGLASGAQEIVRFTKTSADEQGDLLELIQSDPSLVAMILRRVNSSYYRLDKAVQDITVAAKILGCREIRNLAITVHLSRFFQPPVELGTYSSTGLWNHSVAVAAASHLVSRVCGRATPADAYLAGLLHDTGLLLISQQMRRQFMQLMERVTLSKPTNVAEQGIYVFDHAQLGAHVATRWGFAAPIVEAIRYHHDLTRYVGNHIDLAYVVAAANYLCSRAGWTSLGIHNVLLPPDQTYRVLGLDEMALAVIWRELEPTLERATFLAKA